MTTETHELDDTTNGIRLYPSASRFADTESRALFRIAGSSFNHRIVRCGNQITLDAQPSVIASHTMTNSDYNAGTVTDGDILVVEGQAYVVTAHRFAEPELVATDH